MCMEKKKMKYMKPDVKYKCKQLISTYIFCGVVRNFRVWAIDLVISRDIDLVISWDKVWTDGHCWKQCSCARHLSWEANLGSKIFFWLAQHFLMEATIWNKIFAKIFTNHENCRGFCVFEIPDDAVVTLPNGQHHLHPTKIKLYAFYMCDSLYEWLNFKEEGQILFSFHKMSWTNRDEYNNPVFLCLCVFFF